MLCLLVFETLKISDASLDKTLTVLMKTFAVQKLPRLLQSNVSVASYFCIVCSHTDLQKKYF